MTPIGNISRASAGQQAGSMGAAAAVARLRAAVEVREQRGPRRPGGAVGAQTPAAPRGTLSQIGIYFGSTESKSLTACIVPSQQKASNFKLKLQATQVEN